MDLRAAAGFARRTRPTAATEISERHRHRYEFNREYEALLTGGGLRITGTTPDATYVEIVEIPGHPFFLGCQFHPEFKSKPLEPHPLFRDFVTASYKNRLRSKVAQRGVSPRNRLHLSRISFMAHQANSRRPLSCPQALCRM